MGETEYSTPISRKILFPLTQSLSDRRINGEICVSWVGRLEVRTVPLTHTLESRINVRTPMLINF